MLERPTVRLNKQIVHEGLVILTWGNGSIIDPEQKQIYIKPSGVSVDELTEGDISVVDFTGRTSCQAQCLDQIQP